ncbi:MAG: preprotein translocase subunit SecY, partial [Mycoplasmataceae bacterium]|nr:preprotein translocase subunit SecY [Mycoplasmataceae bacterium]
MMVIFVVIGTITLPGISISNSDMLNSTDSFMGILNTIGGGGLRNFSLVSLGISPFITASLVMTFAQTKLVPPIYRLYQSGPIGSIKINYITYGLTFLFAMIQGIIIIQSLTNSTTSVYI